MDKIVGVIGGVPQSKSRNDDDFADRLSRRYSTVILIVFAFIVSTKQYVGEPINWVPAHFSGNHEEYTNNYCWIRNTYYLPYEESIPKEHESDRRRIIPYYQWIPMIMLLQALLYYIPCVVWRTFSSHSGIDVNNIVEAGKSFTKTELLENREKTLSYMTKQMDRFLASETKLDSNTQTQCTISLSYLLSKTICRCCGRESGTYLITLYIIVKCLYIANVIGQMFMLDQLLAMNFHNYGIEFLQSLGSGDLTDTVRFPRTTMCDIKVRRLGNLQRYTVQCVLPINLFTEKIYLFLWFWMVFVAAVTCWSTLVWIVRSVPQIDQKRYLKRHLQLTKKTIENEKKKFEEFVRDYLCRDGVFVLRMVGKNTNVITVTEFVESLWDNYVRKHADDEDEK